MFIPSLCYGVYFQLQLYYYETQSARPAGNICSCMSKMLHCYIHGFTKTDREGIQEDKSHCTSIELYLGELCHQDAIWNRNLTYVISTYVLKCLLKH